MVNNDTSKQIYTIQSGISEYPIQFEFYDNDDNTPQLHITIADNTLEFNSDYTISNDRLNVVLDSETLNASIGKELIIQRGIPFTQTSDYSVGRISPEQIEKDFDASVMRDQQLAQELENYTVDLATAEALAYAATETANTALSIANSASTTATNAFGVADSAIDIANDAKDTAVQASTDSVDAITKSEEAIQKATNAEAVAATAATTAQSAQTSAQNAEAAVANKQDKLTAGANITIDGNTISATGGGGASAASEISFDPSSSSVVSAQNVQEALSQLDSETAKLVKDSSILTTWIGLNAWVGAETDVALRDISIIENLDTRPSYKDVGAVVINDAQRVIGIIDRINEQVPDEWDESGFADHAIVKTIFVATQSHIDTSGFEKKIPWDGGFYGNKASWNAYEQKLVLKTYSNLLEGKYHVYLKTCRKATNADNTSLAADTQTKFIDIITRFDFEIDWEGNVVSQKASLVAPLSGSEWQNPLIVDQNCDGLGLARLEDGSGYIFSSCKGNSVFSTDFFMNAAEGEEREVFAWSQIIDYNDVPQWGFDEQSLTGDMWTAPEGGGALYQSVPVGLPVIKGLGNYSTGNVAIVGDFGDDNILQFAGCITLPHLSSAATDLGVGGAIVPAVQVVFVRIDPETLANSYAIIEFTAYPNNVYSRVVDATGDFANVNWAFIQRDYSNFGTGGLRPHGLETKTTAIFVSYAGNINGKPINASIETVYASAQDHFPVAPLRVAKAVWLEFEEEVNILPQCGGMVLISGVKTVDDAVQPGVAENIVINLPFPMDTVTDEYSGEETFRKYYPQISVMTEGTFRHIIANIGELRADSFDVCLANMDAEAADIISISWSVLAKMPRRAWWV